MNEITASTATQLLFDDHAFGRLERMAEIMASGRATIPQHLRGSTGDCFAILMQAARWGMDPYAVAQKTHVINGTLGYEAQLVAAVINQSRIVADRFHFDWYGPWERIVGKFEIRKGDKGEYRVPAWKMADEDGIGVRVWATLRGESEPRELSLLLAQARTRNSTLWADDPKQQLAYLAQKRWARLYAPDVIMGVYTADELEDRAEKDITPQPAKAETPSAPSLRERVRKAVSQQETQTIPTPTLDDIKMRINAAQDEPALIAIRDDARHLKGADKDMARELWAMKLDLIRSAAERHAGVDEDGVIEEQQP